MPPGKLGSGSYVGVLAGKAYHRVTAGGLSSLYAFDGEAWTRVGAMPAAGIGNDTYVGVLGGKAFHWVVDPISGGGAMMAFDGASWTSVATNTPSGPVGGFLSQGVAGSYVGTF